MSTPVRDQARFSARLQKAQQAITNLRAPHAAGRHEPGSLAGLDAKTIDDLAWGYWRLLRLHDTSYVAGGVRYESTVIAYCQDFDGCDGTADEPCAVEEHEVPSCKECRIAVDADMPGEYFYPCPTARLIVDTLIGEAARIRGDR